MSEIVKKGIENVKNNFNDLDSQVSSLEEKLKNATKIGTELKNEFIKVSYELNGLKDSDLTKEVQELKNKLENALKNLPDSLKEFLIENSGELLREISGDFGISLTLVLNGSITDSNELEINEYKDEIKSLGINFNFSEIEENNNEIGNLNNEKEEYKGTPKESEINSNILQSKGSLLEKFQSLDEIINNEKTKIKNTKNQMGEYLDSLKEVLKERFVGTFESGKINSMLGKFELSSINSAKNMKELNSAFDGKIDELKNIDKKILKSLKDKFNEINKYNEDENGRYFGKFNNFKNTLETKISEYKQIINNDANYEFYNLKYSEKTKHTEKVLTGKKERKAERMIRGRKKRNETSGFIRGNGRRITQDSTPRDTKDKVVYDTKTKYTYEDKQVEKEGVSDFVKKIEEGKKDLTSLAFENIKSFEEDLKNKEEIFNGKVEGIKNQINNFNFLDGLKNDVEGGTEDGCCEDLLNNIKLLFDNLDYVKEYLLKQSISNDKSFEIFEDIFEGLDSDSLKKFREEKAKKGSFKNIFDNIVKNIKKNERAKEEGYEKDNNTSEETDEDNLGSNEGDSVNAEIIDEDEESKDEESLDDEGDIIDVEAIEENGYNFPNIKKWSEFKNPEHQKLKEELNSRLESLDKLTLKMAGLGTNVSKFLGDIKETFVSIEESLEDDNFDYYSYIAELDEISEKLNEGINTIEEEFKKGIAEINDQENYLKKLDTELPQKLKDLKEDFEEKLESLNKIKNQIEIDLDGIRGYLDKANELKQKAEDKKEELEEIEEVEIDKDIQALDFEIEESFSDTKKVPIKSNSNTTGESDGLLGNESKTFIKPLNKTNILAKKSEKPDYSTIWPPINWGNIKTGWF